RPRPARLAGRRRHRRDRGGPRDFRAPARVGVGALALDFDAVRGDARPLWRAWLEDVARRARVEVELPEDRVAAAAALDGALGNWRALLERFAEDRAPVHLRPSAEVNAALRRLASEGVRLGAFTDAPEPL